MSRPVFSVDAEALNETDKALLCLIEGEEVWVPKSVIDDASEVWTVHPHGMDGRLIVQLWWAEREGLT